MSTVDPAVLVGRALGRGVGDLSRDESLALLRSSEVGRVAFTTPDGVRIVPVNHVVRPDTAGRGDVVEFRTTSGSELAVHAPGTQVAFEVDQIDPATRSGWSVVVLGECVRDLDNFGVHRPGEDAAEPWAGGRRPMVLTLSVRRVSGKVVGIAGFDALHG